MHREGHLSTGAGRIAIFMGDLSAAGGAERLVFEEARALRTAGHDVRILTFQLHDDATFSGRYRDDVTVIPLGQHGSLGRFALATLGLIRFLRRWRPDLVIAMSTNECARLLMPTTLIRTPYLTHINGTQFWFPPEQDLTKYAWSYRRALKTVLAVSPGHSEFVPQSVAGIGVRRRLRIELSALLHRVAVRRARQRITFSRRMAWEVELMYGRPAVSNKGAFPRSLLDHQVTSDRASGVRIRGGPVILNVNRLEPRKRVALTIAAFELFRREHADAVLVIGGVGPSEPELRALVEHRQLAQSVHFLGFVAEHELWDWLATCDVFVHPNWAEFAIAPYEALAVGTNVVWTTEMELDPELERYPHIFPSQPEPAAMARQIAAALAAPRATPGQRQALRVFSWEEYFARLERIISSEIGRGAKGAPRR